MRGATTEFEREVQQASEWYESGPAKREAEMLRVWELRKSQGWNPVYVKGETALIDSLLEAGVSPEDIANATLKEDWHSLVAKFVRSPEYLKIMGLG